jgi:hypothetical protein
VALRSGESTSAAIAYDPRAVVLAVTLYNVSVAVHIGLVVIAFGSPFTYPIIQMTAEKRSPRNVPFALRLIGRIDRGMVTPVAVLVGLTGVYQWIKGDWDLGRDQWLSIGIGLYLLAFATALWAFRPAVLDAAADEAQACIDRAGPDGEVVLSDEYRRRMRLPNTVGPMLGLAVLVIVYLMRVKPF